MKPIDYIKANRAAWNEAAPFHKNTDDFKEMERSIGQPGYSALDAVQTEWLTKIGVKGKDVVHLCCNNGKELLSIEKMGAGKCVGFDISSEFIDQARHLAKGAELTSEFIESDIYDISSRFDQQFDLCVITIGVFGWMPDLGRFFDVVNRLMRPGGKLFVHETHPVMNMFEPNDDDPFAMANSYFKPEPFVETDIIVYDDSDAGSGETHYWFVYSLSDIITGVIGSGLKLDALREYEDNIDSEEFDVYEDQKAQLPLSYALMASKSA